MIYINRNLKDGGLISNGTYKSDFGITADKLLANEQKVFCHVDDDGDVLVETLCFDTKTISTEVRQFTGAYLAILLTQLKRAAAFEKQLRGLVSAMPKSQIPPPEFHDNKARAILYPTGNGGVA